MKQTEHATRAMKEIMEKLANPRKPGNWWKQQVLDKVARGESVSTLAEKLARG